MVRGTEDPQVMASRRKPDQAQHSPPDPIGDSTTNTNENHNTISTPFTNELSLNKQTLTTPNTQHNTEAWIPKSTFHLSTRPTTLPGYLTSVTRQQQQPTTPLYIFKIVPPHQIIPQPPPLSTKKEHTPGDHHFNCPHRHHHTHLITENRP